MLDLFAIPNFYIRKGQPHGHRYGKKEGCKEFHTAKQLQKRCRKKQYENIHDRFFRDTLFRKTMIELGRSEEVILDMDRLAREDHSHIATEEGVKSTSPVTENHYKNGYVNYNIYKNFIMTNEDNSDTKYTINNDTNNHDTRDLHKWAQQRAVSRLSSLDDNVSHHIGSSFIESFHLTSSACCTCVVLSDLFDLSFYFNLSFPVFFLSSVLMHPDLHTDLNNLDSVENNLRHSAKGSLDAYDVTHSLTGYEPNDTVSNDTVSNELRRLPGSLLLRYFRHRTRT